MPTYDYRCRACGHALEVFQSISEPARRKCPACGKSALERLIGAGAGFLFRGGGFYQTDYRSEAYKQAESAEKGTTKPAESQEKGSPKPSEAPKSDATTSPKTDAKSESSTPAEPKHGAKKRKKD